MDEGVKISKSNKIPIVLEITDLHFKSAFVNSRMPTVFILSAVEVSLYTHFGRGVA